MKVKWVALVIAIVILIYMGATVFAEIAYYNTAAASINRTVILAAEQAVTQVLASDELFTADVSGIGRYKNESYSTVKIADGFANSYTNANLFDVVYKTNGDKDTLFTLMYQQNALFEDAAYMRELCKVSTQINDTLRIPLIARMGLLTGNGSGSNAMLVGTAYDELKTAVDDGGYPMSMVKYSGRDWMHLYETKKEYTTHTKNSEYYYLAPTNVGVTYLDPNILQTAFATNMDVLMRASVAQSNRLSDNVGIPDALFGGGEDYVITDVTADTVERQNIINNGNFAYVKGERSPLVGVGYTGGYNADNDYIVPEISYKVVDVCDPANETLIRMSVSEIEGVSDFESYQNWLVNRGIDVTQPHYCVVAKITFYADIIVPYGTALSRNLYSLYSRENADAAKDFFQINYDSQNLLQQGMPDFYTSKHEMISGITGNPYFTYTTYAAILP